MFSKKKPDAFKILDSAKFDGGVVAGNASRVFQWVVQTSLDCPITDKSKSPFFLYGRGKAYELGGVLQSQILPLPVISEFVSIFTTQFKFLNKHIKTVGGAVEAKVIPPESKNFAWLEYLVLRFQPDQDALDVTYTFHTKKVEASAAHLSLKKQKDQTVQRLDPSVLKIASGRFNHDAMETAIREALALFQGKPLD